MRLLLPSQGTRRNIAKHLTLYYQNMDKYGLQKAITLFVRFYKIRRPKKIEWYEYLDHGKTLGITHENGVIHLVHPSHWKLSLSDWIEVFYHELYHFLYWCDDENKAWEYAGGMMKGCEIPK